MFLGEEEPRRILKEMIAQAPFLENIYFHLVIAPELNSRVASMIAGAANIAGTFHFPGCNDNNSAMRSGTGELNCAGTALYVRFSAISSAINSAVDRIEKYFTLPSSLYSSE
ncbi:MAG: hypothetical protein ABSD44_00155 [Terracidiphilus sp.]